MKNKKLYVILCLFILIMGSLIGLKLFNRKPVSKKTKQKSIDVVVLSSGNEKLTVQDKFDILLYTYKKEYGTNALKKLVDAYNMVSTEISDSSSKDQRDQEFEITKERFQEINGTKHGVLVEEIKPKKK